LFCKCVIFTCIHCSLQCTSTVDIVGLIGGGACGRLAPAGMNLVAFPKGLFDSPGRENQMNEQMINFNVYDFECMTKFKAFFGITP
jgi:hypothetical protein